MNREMKEELTQLERNVGIGIEVAIYRSRRIAKNSLMEVTFYTRDPKYRRKIRNIYVSLVEYLYFIWCSSKEHYCGDVDKHTNVEYDLAKAFVGIWRKCDISDNHYSIFKHMLEEREKGYSQLRKAVVKNYELLLGTNSKICPSSLKEIKNASNERSKARVRAQASGGRNRA
jgi:hypothetical protein